MCTTHDGCCAHSAQVRTKDSQASEMRAPHTPLSKGKEFGQAGLGLRTAWCRR